jgi:hypothetical protein
MGKDDYQASSGLTEKGEFAGDKIFMSGLQPSGSLPVAYLGLPAPASKLAGGPVRPRLVYVAPLALFCGRLS